MGRVGVGKNIQLYFFNTVIFPFFNNVHQILCQEKRVSYSSKSNQRYYAPTATAIVEPRNRGCKNIKCWKNRPAVVPRLAPRFSLAATVFIFSVFFQSQPRPRPRPRVKPRHFNYRAPGYGRNLFHICSIDLFHCNSNALPVRCIKMYVQFIYWSETSRTGMIWKSRWKFCGWVNPE